MKEIYDVIIIGTGPAGLSAAVYAGRARLKALVLEKEYVSGGQIVTTAEVDNYLGLPGVNGFDMAMKFREHAVSMGAEFAEGKVTGIEKTGDNWCVQTEDGQYLTRSVVISTGASHRMLDIPGEKEFKGRGVSYCATCDGAFFRERTVAVVGGGDVAVEDAIFLSRLCKKVYLIHRRDSLRAAKLMSDRVQQLENVEILWNTVPLRIEGEEQVTGLLVRMLPDGEERLLALDGVFIAVGMVPNVMGVPEEIIDGEQGYVAAGEDGKTALPGIYAAGDVRTKRVRQIATAVSDGANVIASVEEYLNTTGNFRKTNPSC